MNGEQLGFGFNLNFGLSQPFLERASQPAPEPIAPVVIDTAKYVTRYRGCAVNKFLVVSYARCAHEPSPIGTILRSVLSGWYFR